MSIRLQAKLSAKQDIRLQSQMMKDATKVENLPCEMTFQTTGAYVRHESEKNGFLPVLQLRGHVTEIRGNFPFGISSVYFSEDDKPELTKECTYLLSPDELSHIITTGAYFTPRFKVPEILSKNKYTFPVMVNAMVIPPNDLEAYERATYGGGFVATTDEEKMNVPMMYVDLKGTQPNREKDALIDYYDLDFDQKFDNYVLTAESTGYSPSLGMYIEAPVVEEQVHTEKQNGFSMEGQLMMEPEPEQEHQAESQETVERLEPIHYPEVSKEDVMLEVASQNVRDKVRTKYQEMIAVKAAEVPLYDIEVKEQFMAEPEVNPAFTQQETKTSPFIGLSPRTPKTEKPVSVAHVDDKPQFFNPFESVSSADEELPTLNPFTITPSNSTSDDIRNNLRDNILGVGMKKPAIPQEQVIFEKESQIPSEKMFEAAHDDVNGKQDSTDMPMEDENTDMNILEDAHGGDVSDARMQTKLDEARAREAARNVAVDTQADISADKDTVVEQRNVGETHTAQSSHRAVPSSFQEVVDASQSSSADKNDVELS